MATAGNLAVSLAVGACVLCLLAPPSSGAVIISDGSTSNGNLAIYGANAMAAIGFIMGGNSYIIPANSATSGLDVVLTSTGLGNASKSVLAHAQIWSDSGSAPGSVYASFANLEIFGDSSAVTRHFVTAGPITLAANTTYWLVLWGTVGAGNGNPGRSLNWDYTTAPAWTGSGAIYKSPDPAKGPGPAYTKGPAWTANSPGYFDFKLSDDQIIGVPEPSSIALLGMGLVAIGLLARRRKS